MTSTSCKSERYIEWNQDEFKITDRKKDLDIETIHKFLSESYRAKGIPKTVIQKSINNSLFFGLYHNYKQIGFGRAITDYASFAYVADVFVLPDYRGFVHGNL